MDFDRLVRLVMEGDLNAREDLVRLLVRRGYEMEGIRFPPLRFLDEYEGMTDMLDAIHPGLAEAMGFPPWRGYDVKITEHRWRHDGEDDDFVEDEPYIEWHHANVADDIDIDEFSRWEDVNMIGRPGLEYGIEFVGAQYTDIRGDTVVPVVEIARTDHMKMKGREVEYIRTLAGLDDDF